MIFRRFAAVRQTAVQLTEMRPLPPLRRPSAPGILSDTRRKNVPNIPHFARNKGLAPSRPCAHRVPPTSASSLPASKAPRKGTFPNPAPAAPSPPELARPPDAKQKPGTAALRRGRLCIGFFPRFHPPFRSGKRRKKKVATQQNRPRSPEASPLFAPPTRQRARHQISAPCPPPPPPPDATQFAARTPHPEASGGNPPQHQLGGLEFPRPPAGRHLGQIPDRPRLRLPFSPHIHDHACPRAGRPSADRAQRGACRHQQPRHARSHRSNSPSGSFSIPCADSICPYHPIHAPLEPSDKNGTKSPRAPIRHVPPVVLRAARPLPFHFPPAGGTIFLETTWTTRDNFHKGIGRTTPPDSRSRETIGKQKGQRAKRQTKPSDNSGHSLQKKGQTLPAPHCWLYPCISPIRATWTL